MFVCLSSLPTNSSICLFISAQNKMREEASEFVNQQRGLKTKVRVRRTLKVKIRKTKPMLGIAIEGGYNVSGQLLPRIVCVHVSVDIILLLCICIEMYSIFMFKQAKKNMKT